MPGPTSCDVVQPKNSKMNLSADQVARCPSPLTSPSGGGYFASALNLLFALCHPLVRLPLFVVTLFFCVSCGKSEDSKITVYRIPKETQPNSVAQTVAEDDSSAPAAVHWTAPAGWEKQAASGFRKGSFLVRGTDGKTADVSVISFPEAAGGLLANVNRWRDQLKLAPISDVGQVGAPIPVDGRDMFFVDLASEQPISPDGSKSRILGGIFPTNGETWFFKMIGPDQLVESQRDAFRQFLESVHVTEGAVATDTGTDEREYGRERYECPHPAANRGGPRRRRCNTRSQRTGRRSRSRPMRLASFKAIAPNGKETDISVVSLPGIAGGDLANVNRWRGQVQLEPIDEDYAGEISRTCAGEWA